jgi:hypothetical protein
VRKLISLDIKKYPISKGDSRKIVGYYFYTYIFGFYYTFLVQIVVMDGSFALGSVHGKDYPTYIYFNIRWNEQML